MRIGLDVHVLTGAPQGTASAWRNLLPALPAGHTYVLYSFDPSRTRAEFPQAHFEHRRIPVHQPHLRIEVVYPWLARRDRCDVFHVNYFGPLFGAPGLVVTCHDVLYLDFPELAPLSKRLQMRYLCGWTVRAARRVITDSAYSRERIAHHFGISPERIAIIYPPVDATWLSPDSAALDRAWEGVRHRVPERYILGVGRLEPRKNVVLTARMAAEARSLGLTDGLVWVGPDDFGTRAITQALDAEGLTPLVTRLSGLSTLELQAVYRHAQMLLFLSVAEGFGYPPIEAMAMGTPVVTSPRTSLAEVVGEAAWTVDPDDPRAVIDAVRTMLTRPEIAKGYVDAGLRHSRRFSADASAEQTAALYESVAT